MSICVTFDIEVSSQNLKVKLYNLFKHRFCIVKSLRQLPYARKIFSGLAHDKSILMYAVVQRFYHACKILKRNILLGKPGTIVRDNLFKCATGPIMLYH